MGASLTLAVARRDHLRPAGQTTRARASPIGRGPHAAAVVLATAGALASLACGARVPRRHAAAAALPVTGSVARVVSIGRSVQGRPIVARVVGDAHAARPVLVVGCVHGDEPAGIAITRRLRSTTPPPGVALWLVDEFNPDGCAAHARQNAHGVDLNRNSPARWRPLTGPFYSGPRPLSEPESRAIHRLVTRLRPAITIWYHQHAALVDDSGGDQAVERRYARIVRLPFRHFGDKPGSITHWQNTTFPADTAFVVELPAGRLSRSAVARHANAVLALGARLPPERGDAQARGLQRLFSRSPVRVARRRGRASRAAGRGSPRRRSAPTGVRPPTNAPCAQ